MTLNTYYGSSTTPLPWARTSRRACASRLMPPQRREHGAARTLRQRSGRSHEVDSRPFFPLHSKHADRRQKNVRQGSSGASSARAGKESPGQPRGQCAVDAAASPCASSLVFSRRQSSSTALAAASGKRRKSRLEVLGLERGLVVLSRLRRPGVTAGDRIDLTFHRLHRGGLALFECRDVFGNPFCKRATFHQLSQKTDSEHLRVANCLRGQEQPFCVARSQCFDVAAQTSGVIVQPELRRRHEHARAANSDAEVAAQGQIGRPAVNAPVEGAEGRQREAFNLVEKLFETMIQSVDDGVDGVTRAESLVTCAGDYYGENAAPHRDFAKLFAHYPNVVGIDAIVGRRAAQANRRSRAMNFQDRRPFGRN